MSKSVKKQQRPGGKKKGRRLAPSESFKPVITVGDAQQIWGFHQLVEAKQIPNHGLLQGETDLGCAAEGGYSVPRFYLMRTEMSC